MYGLHRAAQDGSFARTKALLSAGSVDIDQRAAPGSMTPLMVAAINGHDAVARILMSKGANRSLVNDEGAAALHMSAQTWK